MSSPSFENIDRWLFEYAEGNLSPAQVEQLEQFLFLNPDLAIEKDAWDSAKVSPTHTPTFSVASMQRANPLPLFLWTGIAGFFLIATAAIAFDSSLVSVSSRYVKQTIDTSVIEDYSDAEDEFLAVNTSLKSKNSSTSTKLSVNVTDKSNTLSKYSTSSYSKQSKNGENKLSNETTIESNLKNNENSISISVDNTNDYTDVNPLLNDAFTAPGLQSVVDALSSTTQLEETIATTNNRASVKSSKSAGVSSSKVIRRKFKETFRKIKRMADQPVALRNYKDPYFHVPFMTGYQANFGMVGTLLSNRFQATTRNQFVGRENQQFMNTLSWDGYIYALRGGLGIDVNYSDYQNGSLQNFNAGLTYSPKFSINNNISIEPAVRFKMGMIDLDTESPIIGNQIEMNRRSVLGVFDQGKQPIGSQLWYRDIGAGVLLNTKWFYAGFNMDNVSRHYNNFYSADINSNHQADLNMTSIIGTSYAPQGKNITYSAYILHQKFADLNEVWGGANLRWNWFEFGGGVSNNLDFGASAGVNLDKFSLHYNIDYLDSRLLNMQLLSHQVTMRVILKPTGMASRFLSL